MSEKDGRDAADWSVATWEGSRRETLRRWAALPLERMIAALEEMEETARALAPESRGAATSVGGPTESAAGRPKAGD